MSEENMALLKAAEVDKALEKLIESASPNLLRVIAKGCGLGVRIRNRKKVKIVPTIGCLERPEFEVDRVDLYLDRPYHYLPVATVYADADLDGCKIWLAEEGICIEELNLIPVDEEQSVIDRKIDEILFANAAVLESLRSELLYGLDDSTWHVKFELGFEYPDQEGEVEKVLVPH